MKQGFVPYGKEIQKLLDQVVKDPQLHGLWLNALSYLENCGARKIASCEHPTAVKEEMLKHAAEEFRHAFYLKKQLIRIDQNYEDYRRSSLLGGVAAYHYLNALDLQASRYLRELNINLAYPLVTYAIELRAEELYPLYQTCLKQLHSKIQVQSILLEEKEHLQEMEETLRKIPNASIHIKNICQIEATLFEKWLKACKKQLP